MPDFRLSLAAIMTAAIAPLAIGCGIDWTLPSNHFDGVNDHGHVSYWEKIGEIDLGPELKLPLHINFRSSRESTSPYLGKGWILALLESNIVQTSEDAFKLVQPEGRTRLFWRNKKRVNLLDGQGGWKGEIVGERVTVWADCGWKLTFVKGKITSLTTPKNRRLEYFYAEGVVREIRESGTALLAVERDTRSGVVKGLAYNGKHLKISQVQRPRVQGIGREATVGGIDSSLGHLAGPEAIDHHFDYALKDAVRPTLRITGPGNTERLLVWDAASKRISGDGPWTYQLTQSEKEAGSIAIERKNIQGQTEFWHDDGAKGVETARGIDGVTRIRRWFVSGILAGRMRQIVSVTAGAERVDFQAAYDEQGNTLRETRGKMAIAYEAGKPRAITDASVSSPVVIFGRSN